MNRSCGVRFSWINIVSRPGRQGVRTGVVWEWRLIEKVGHCRCWEGMWVIRVLWSNGKGGLPIDCHRNRELGTLVHVSSGWRAQWTGRRIIGKCAVDRM